MPRQYNMEKGVGREGQTERGAPDHGEAPAFAVIIPESH